MKRDRNIASSQQADFVLINVPLFDMLSAISSGKVGDKSEIFFLSEEW